MSDEQPVLWELQNVTLGAGHRPRLDHVNLTLRRGVTAILGPSGAGKTSLLNLLVQFEQPAAGQITRYLNAAADAGAFHTPLYWAPPDHGLWSHLTTRQHVEAVMPPASTNSPQNQQASEILEALGILHIEGQRPASMSQGEKARLSLARVLAAAPAVMVLDEPLVHVDPARVGGYWRVLREHVRSSGASMVFSTHEPRRVLGEANEVVCLDAGRVLYDGPVDTLYHHPPSEQAGRCLGEGNWLTENDYVQWQITPVEDASPHAGTPAPGMVRPERLRIEADDASAVTVRHASFQGAVEQLDLAPADAAAPRAFFHRPAGPSFKPGDRVRLRVLPALLALCMLLLTFGCNDTGPTPQLSFAHSEHWTMPTEGASIPAPRSITVDQANDEVYVLDTVGRVLVFDRTGKLARKWWMPDYDKGRPEGLCLLEDGRIAVADTHYSRIVLFDRQGNVLSTFGEPGKNDGQFVYPVSIVQNDDGLLFICEYGSNDRVQVFSPQGEFLFKFAGPGTEPGKFQRPSGMVWHEGNLYISDAINSRVQVFSDEGEFLGVLANNSQPIDMHFPYDIAMGDDQVIWVCEHGAGRITAMRTDGQVVGWFGQRGNEFGQFSTPWGLDIDSTGRIIVADTGNRRIVVLTR